MSPFGLQARRLLAATLLTAAATGLAACSTDATSPEARTTTTPTSAPSASETPTETQTGVPFSLNTHCGISSTEYAGRWWVAESPRPRPRDLPDGTGITTGDGHTEGTLTVVDDDLLRFVVTDPLVEEIGLTVDFVPAAVPPPLCE